MRIFIYLLIGGILAGMMDRTYVNRCNNHMSEESLIGMAIMWPAAMGYGIAAKSTGETLCEGEQP